MVGIAVGLHGVRKNILRHKCTLQLDLLQQHNGEFNDPEGALGAGSTDPPSDARSAYPGAVAAAIARYPDGVQVSMIESRDSATARHGIAAYLPELPARNLRPTSHGIRFTIDGDEFGEVVWMGRFVFIFIGPSWRAISQRLARTPALHDQPITPPAQIQSRHRRHAVRG